MRLILALNYILCYLAIAINAIFSLFILIASVHSYSAHWTTVFPAFVASVYFEFWITRKRLFLKNGVELEKINKFILTSKGANLLVSTLYLFNALAFIIMAGLVYFICSLGGYPVLSLRGLFYSIIAFMLTWRNFYLTRMKGALHAAIYELLISSLFMIIFLSFFRAFTNLSAGKSWWGNLLIKIFLP